jgi:hypothetical protein
MRSNRFERDETRRRRDRRADRLRGQKGVRVIRADRWLAATAMLAAPTAGPIEAQMAPPIDAITCDPLQQRADPAAGCKAKAG